MMSPKVFISATSGDLVTARRQATEALLKLECQPVAQDVFPSAAGELRKMLEKKIKECHAVVHIAGFRYGHEPATKEDGEQRRSYTQMEYDTAMDLHKPVYLFLPDEGFPFDVPAEGAEDEERRLLQLAHREALKATGLVYQHIASDAQLREKLRELQVVVDALRAELTAQQKEMEASRKVFSAHLSFMRRSMTVLSIIVAVAIGALVVQARQQSIELAEVRKALKQPEVERKLNPGPEERATPGETTALQDVAHVLGTGEADAARRTFSYFKEVDANPNSSPADKKLADLIRPNVDAIAEAALTSSDIREVAAKIELDEREKRRNSFAAGLAGPLSFVMKALTSPLDQSTGPMAVVSSDWGNPQPMFDIKKGIGNSVDPSSGVASDPIQTYEAGKRLSELMSPHGLFGLNNPPGKPDDLSRLVATPKPLPPNDSLRLQKFLSGKPGDSPPLIAPKPLGLHEPFLGNNVSKPADSPSIVTPQPASSEKPSDKDQLTRKPDDSPPPVVASKPVGLDKPFDIGQFIRKPGDPPVANEHLWTDPSVWEAGFAKAWNDTWGLGPGNYRAGFITGCFFFGLLILRKLSGR